MCDVCRPYRMHRTDETADGRNQKAKQAKPLLVAPQPSSGRTHIERACSLSSAQSYDLKENRNMRNYKLFEAFEVSDDNNSAGVTKGQFVITVNSMDPGNGNHANDKVNLEVVQTKEDALARSKAVRAAMDNGVFDPHVHQDPPDQVDYTDSVALTIIVV